MNQFYPYYIACWGSACVLALVLFLRERQTYALFQRRYLLFLASPWKIGTFVVATVGLTLMAPYTGDPTWDYVDALVMSILTYLTAPWVVGVLYKTVAGKLPLRQAYVAFCIWMFTASWFYDTYILIRDGAYTPLWLPNIFASSALYLAGGMLWNLAWTATRGTFFAFMEDDWPGPSQGLVFHRIIWWALVFMLLVVAMVVPFLFDDYFPIHVWFDRI